MYGVYVIGPDTIILSEDYLGVWKMENPPCKAEDIKPDSTSSLKAS